MRGEAHGFTVRPRPKLAGALGIEQAMNAAMFGFWRRAGNLEKLAGSEFLLDIGGQALRGRGPVRVVCADLGFDLRIGPATLHTMDGAPWSVHPFSMEAGLAGVVQLEGRSFSPRAGAFNVMELPDAVWFGPDLRLTEHPTSGERRVLSTETVCLGITQQQRFRKSLEKVEWIRSESPREQETESLSPPDLVHRSALPEQHSAVYVAPELYAVLRDEDGNQKFSFPREDYEDALQRWTSVAVPVWDEEFPASAQSSLHRLESTLSPFPSSLLLLPWLGPELQRRCRGEPILQLVGYRLCWLDSADAPWHDLLRAEVGRLTAKSWGTPWGPPLRYEHGHWVAAGEVLEA